jgi:LacI family repressor for deo operon, udp, cdd, tsx, nupC, and nupG
MSDNENVCVYCASEIFLLTAWVLRRTDACGACPIARLELSLSRRSMPTMKDVAAKAGVSLASVSRALSATTDVSDNLRRRIEQAAQDLDYTVNFNARSLRSESSGMIVVLVQDIANAFFPVLLQGIEEQARAMGKAVLIADTASDNELAATYGKMLEGRRADGMILLNGNLPRSGAKNSRTLARRFPIVVISERIADAPIPTVSIDNIGACFEMVGYLAQIGHRRIVHLMGPADNVLSRERAEGFRTGIAHFHCDAPTDCIQPSGFTIRSGRHAMAQVLNGKLRPTAVFASNDESAIGAIIEAKARGLRVPDDITVVGFDDIEFAQSYDPSLTTVYQPRREMGRKAMEILGRLIADPRKPQPDALLDYKLVVRASSAPPPKR